MDFPVIAFVLYIVRSIRSFSPFVKRNMGTGPVFRVCTDFGRSRPGGSISDRHPPDGSAGYGADGRSGRNRPDGIQNSRCSDAGNSRSSDRHAGWFPFLSPQIYFCKHSIADKIGDIEF